MTSDEQNEVNCSMEPGIKKNMTNGVMVGNRGFFPAELSRAGRVRLLAALAKRGDKAIGLAPNETSACGAIESLADARSCAAHLRAHAAKLDGLIVTLPNCGDERNRRRVAPERT